MRNLLRLAWTALLLLIVALASALITMRVAIHGQEVRVPDLRGKTPAEARQLAEALGISAQVERQFYSPTVPQDRVLSQVPEPGTTVRRGWQVRVAVSLGPQRVSIPQVVGESERAAVITLAQRGLQLGAGAHVHYSDAPSGYVMGQDPPHDATGVSAPKVNLLIADGAEPEKYVMPSFVGQPLGSVTNTLRDAGFSVGKVTVQPESAPVVNSPAVASVPAASSPSAVPVTATSPAAATAVSPESIIMSQDPTPGRQIASGSAINFVVR